MVLFQNVFSYKNNTITNHYDHPVLKSMLEVFYMFVAKILYGDNKYLVGEWIWCTSCDRHVHYDISDSVTKYIISVFITIVCFVMLVFHV